MRLTQYLVDKATWCARSAGGLELCAGVSPADVHWGAITDPSTARTMDRTMAGTKIRLLQNYQSQ